jgi:putative metallohydrolase (TIGR04338 family)
MSRDAQRADVYAVEDIVGKMIDTAAEQGITTLQIAGSTIPVPIERKFGDLAGVQRYVDLVMSRVAADYGVPREITVRARKGDRRAHYEHFTAVIAVPLHPNRGQSWAMRELVVLHEIAHHLTSKADQSHGPEFVAAELDLMDRFMGPETAFLFRVLAYDSGVKVG